MEELEVDFTWQSCQPAVRSSLNQNGKQDFNFWRGILEKPIGNQVSFLIFRSNIEHNFLSYIEIWENTGDLTNPNYQGIILDNSDDHQFDVTSWGEISRINLDECELSSP